MESSFVMMFQGGFVFLVCLVHEIKNLRVNRDFSPLYLWAGFIGISWFAFGLINCIMGK